MQKSENNIKIHWFSDTCSVITEQGIVLKADFCWIIKIISQTLHLVLLTICQTTWKFNKYKNNLHKSGCNYHLEFKTIGNNIGKFIKYWGRLGFDMWLIFQFCHCLSNTNYKWSLIIQVNDLKNDLREYNFLIFYNWPSLRHFSNFTIKLFEQLFMSPGTENTSQQSVFQMEWFTKCWPNKIYIYILVFTC